MRTPTCTLLLGTNGTGKTTLLAEFIAKNVKAGRRVLIITPDDAEWENVNYLTESEQPYDTAREMRDFTGVRKLIYTGVETTEAIYKNYHDGLLVLDDYKAFGISSQAETKTLRQIMIRRRHRMLDIAIVAHGFTEVVPMFLFSFSTHIALFRTVDSMSRAKSAIKDYEKMKALQTQVNEKAKKDQYYYRIIKQ